jgi:hypothetical protein
MSKLNLYRPATGYWSAICFSAILLCGCGNQALQQPGKTAGTGSSSTPATDPIIDTNKIKADVNEIQNALTPGKLPDTTALKLAAGDVLSTTAKVLSDSGISKMGNSSDPSQKAAQDEMVKLRNASGLTPAALDSLKKAAALLNNN